METPARPTPDVHAELQSLRWGIRWVFALMVLMATAFAVFRLSGAPRYRGIFEDMMGPGAELPLLTTFFIRHFVPLMAGTALFGFGAAAWLVTRRSSGAILVTGSIVVFLLLAWALSIEASMASPLRTILHEINGK